MRRARVGALAVLLLVAFLPREPQARKHYAMARDPASSHGARYVQHRPTRQWVHLHCELRAPLQRALPDPISTDESGDLMSTTYFTGATMGSGDVTPRRWTVLDGHRVWRMRRVARGADLDDSSSFGVQLSFADGRDAEGALRLRREPMEVFALPSLGTLTLYEWSAWARADEIRAAEFAGWEKLEGRPPDAATPPQHAFQLRCRTVLSDVVYVAGEEEDANLARPDPRATR